MPATQSSAVAAAPSGTPVSSDAEFPSSAAVARIRELADSIGRRKSELADADRALALASKNRDLLELTGGNPDESVRKAKASVDLAKSKLSGMKNDFTRTFVAARDECEKTRSALWAQTHSEVVGPRAAKIAAAMEAFDGVVDEIAALLQPDSETIRQLDALDAATNQWNQLVAELGGPGNATLNVAPGVTRLRASFAQSVNFKRFELALKTIKDVLNPPPAPVPPKTEEQIVAERDRAAENALVVANRQKAENELAASRENTLLQLKK